MANVCKDCERRHQGCHAECEDYLAERAVRLKEYDERLDRAKVKNASIALIERRGRKR